MNWWARVQCMWLEKLQAACCEATVCMCLKSSPPQPRSTQLLWPLPFPQQNKVRFVSCARVSSTLHATQYFHC